MLDYDPVCTNAVLSASAELVCLSVRFVIEDILEILHLFCAHFQNAAIHHYPFAGGNSHIEAAQACGRS